MAKKSVSTGSISLIMLPSESALKKRGLEGLTQSLGCSGTFPNSMAIVYGGLENKWPPIKTMKVEIENPDLRKFLDRDPVLTSRALTEYTESIQGSQIDGEWKKWSRNKKFREPLRGLTEMMRDLLESADLPEISKPKYDLVLCDEGLRMSQELMFVWSLTKAWANPVSKPDTETLLSACWEFAPLFKPKIEDLSPSPAQPV